MQYFIEGAKPTEINSLDRTAKPYNRRDYYTEEQIMKARSIDLLTYLQRYEPTELVHVRGDTYCLRSYDSFKISASKGGKWYWWSRGFGGSSALVYLVKVKGMPFIQAMQTLEDEIDITPNPLIAPEEAHTHEKKRRLILPERLETNLEVIRYLSGRGIDREIIKECIDDGLLMII